MRVITGTARGIQLKTPEGMVTRPTADRVKEAMFSIIHFDIPGADVLDLFGGTGQLGIEALSRGMDKAVFVDREYKAVATVKDNLRTCRLEEQAEVYKNDSERALKALIKREMTFDLILLDPPYKKQKLVDILGTVTANNMLADDGIILCEHGSDVELPDEVGPLERWRYEKYGMIAITLYKMRER